MFGFFKKIWTVEKKKNENYGRPVITNPSAYIKNMSTFTVDCFDACYKDPHFFQWFYFHKDNPWKVNWSRIVRTYKESGGDVNYHRSDHCHFVEPIIQFNMTSKILTPDLYRELVECGFTLDGKEKSQIDSYGEIGSLGVVDNNDLKIEVMDLLCRDFGWFDLIEDDSVIKYAFGIRKSDYGKKYNLCHRNKVNSKLIKMYLKHDTKGRIKKMWGELPDYIKEEMDEGVCEVMNSLSHK